MIAAASPSLPATGAPTLGVAAAPSPAEQKRAQAEKARLQDFQSALTTLKSIGQSAKSTASGLAAEKLEALKQRLKMLMMFGGDPKQIAKEAAQIAKEIGQAAKDYAQAAGGSASAAAPAPAQDSSDANAAPAAADGTKDPADAPADSAPAVAATATPAAAPGDGKAAPDGSKANSEAAKSKPTAALAAARPSGPDAVLEEAKQLAARAKAILKAAIEKAKLQHADPMELQDDENKMSAAEKAIRDAEKAMGADAASTGYAPDGQPAAAPAAPPTPSVSVQA